jgi:hypothetical protein
MRHVTSLLAFSLLAASLAFGQSRDSSASITYTRAGVAKPPGLTFYATLRLHNTKSKPHWFLLPYDLDRPLAEDGAFRVENWMDHPFVLDTLYGRRKDRFGEASRVRLIGCFNSYLLAPGATLTISEEQFHASRGTRHRTIQMWEAEVLLVDGVTPLEKWVPFNVCSESDLSVPNQFAFGEELAEFKRVKDLNYYHHPKRWPEQKVKVVKAGQIEKHQVPLQGAPE